MHSPTAKAQGHPCLMAPSLALQARIGLYGHPRRHALFLLKLAFQPNARQSPISLDRRDRNPQNLGTIIRVAEAVGALGLVLTARRAPPLGAAVARASAGAVEHLPVSRVGNLRRALGQLKDGGFWVIGADAETGEDLFQTRDRIWQGDLVLVFGAEGRGIRRGVLELLDHRIRIPMVGRVGSLNVASAAAVVLFEVVRRGRTG